MPTPTNARLALWLDPFRPLTVADHAQLAAAGVDAQPLSTLDDVQATLQATPAAMLVLGLGPTLNS